MVNKQTTTQGETTESRKHKENVTTQKNEKSKKKYCTSKVMFNKVGVVGWVSIGFEWAGKQLCILRRKSRHQKESKSLNTEGCLDV